MNRGLALGLAMALLSSCGNDRIGGGTTETGNMLAARVYQVDSLLPAWNHPSEGGTVATLRLGASDLDFSKTSMDGMDLGVESAEGVPLPFRVVFWDRAASLGRLQVRLGPEHLRPGSAIVLRWGLRDSVRSDSAKVWRAIPDSQRLALTSVLVSDFEDSSLVSLLPNAGKWYTLAADSATITPPEIVTAGQGRNGKAVCVRYTIPQTQGYAFLGVPLSGARRSLRSLDSIVLWARGDSTSLRISLEYRSGTKVPKAWTARVLGSGWMRLAIRPVDFDAANGAGGNVGWLGVRDSVENLSLFVSEGREMCMDDIRLYGIDREDLR
jgi:hypothetical protein